MTLTIANKPFDAYMEHEFPSLLHCLAKQIYDRNVTNGFWPNVPPDVENCDPDFAKEFWKQQQAAKLALIHSEVTEALEAVRKPDVKDKHLPHIPAVAVELADVVIRILDYAHHYGLPLGQAILEKHAYNSTRPYRHGGKAL